jgi:hypothetical protein
MNKRTIIVGIVTLAITVCALVAGKTSRLGPVTPALGHGSPIPDADGKSSSVGAFLDQQGNLSVEKTKQAGVQVPDYVVYGQLLRSVMLLKQKGEDEEKRGRLGSGYTRTLQLAMKLDDATNKELDDAATDWDKEREALTAKADALITRYRSEKSKADAEAKEPPAELVTELTQLNDKLNGSILAARDRLREQLGEKAFEQFQRSVDETFTAHIQSLPFDQVINSNPPTKERPSRFQRQTPIPSDLQPGEVRTIPSSSQATAPAANNERSDSTAQKTKRISVGNSERSAGRALDRPHPQFNFCFFGGVVFFGTYEWLAPQVDQVLQVSFTQLDFCAGLNNDPYVYGALYTSFSFTDSDSLGNSFFRPAVILNSLAAFPNTVYVAYALHLLLNCSLEFGCGWVYVIDYYLAILTPSCVPGGMTLGMGPNFNTCPGPSPSPTPTPQVKVDSVGFNGDLPLRHWAKEVQNRKRIDPDGNTPTWQRGRSNFAAAYIRGTNPVMFASFKLNPQTATSRPVQIRVKLGQTVVATKSNAEIGGGGLVPVKDIQVDFTQLESAAVVKQSEYEFNWEVSFDGGTSWANAGKSGKHKIYWTWANPLSSTFKDLNGVISFQTADGLEQDTLYDKALELSAGKTGKNGSDQMDFIVDKINTAVDDGFEYNPCSNAPDGHPLMLTEEKTKAVCDANANLLRGLLRSIGIQATTKYYWGGEGPISPPSSGRAWIYKFLGGEVTMRVERPASSEGANNQLAHFCPDVPRNPHFLYHAMVEVPIETPGFPTLPILYDPSYGASVNEAQIHLVEVKNPAGGFFRGSNPPPADRLVKSDIFRVLDPANREETGQDCGEVADAGNLFPNPIDDAQFFVEQHYEDFLNRVADPGGLAFWTGQITQCNGNPACIDDHRTGVSLAFLLSTEFQDRSSFIQRFYKSSYGRNPTFEEFLPDLGDISHQSGTAEDLERNKQNFADNWVETDAFIAQYPFTMEHAAYVDALFANAGVVPSGAERAALISGLEAETENRASVLRKVVDNQAFISAEYNRAFILLCYFGYLRRTPDIGGYNFWLGILNSENDLYHISRAFILSTEYRARFGQP